MAKNTITLKLRGQALRKEALAGGTITPGHLVQRTSSNTFVVHPNAASNAVPLFATEDDLQGKDIGDDYSSGEQVQANFFAQGEEVYAWLDGESVAVVIGDPLESAGDGTLVKHTPPDLEVSGAAPDLQLNQIVGYALEAVDLSDSGTADGRIEIEIA